MSGHSFGNKPDLLSICYRFLRVCIGGVITCAESQIVAVVGSFVLLPVVLEFVVFLGGLIGVIFICQVAKEESSFGFLYKHLDRGEGLIRLCCTD